MRHPGLLTTVMTLALLGAGACKAETAEEESATAPAATTDTAVPADAAMAPAGPATYRVEVTPLWTKENFPFEYPPADRKPHFSGLIGTAHNASYHIVVPEQAPTPGLERLSEMGKQDPLDAEIKAAIAAGNALALTQSEPLRDLSRPATVEVMVDDAHPFVSLVAMIAPSPDWFMVAEVMLLENGAWVSRTVDAMAWDSGGDDGTTYLAADADTDPKKPTSMAKTRHFTKDGVAMPVARVTFTRM